MAAEHEFMRAVLRGHPRRRRPAWEDIVRGMRAVTRKPSRESEKLLREVLANENHIPLADGAEGPHAMAPRDMLRAEAIQVLARWNLPRHRAAIRAVAESTDSVSLEFVANDWLRVERARPAKTRRR